MKRVKAIPSVTVRRYLKAHLVAKDAADKRTAARDKIMSYVGKGYVMPEQTGELLVQLNDSLVRKVSWRDEADYWMRQAQVLAEKVFPTSRDFRKWETTVDRPIVHEKVCRLNIVPNKEFKR